MPLGNDERNQLIREKNEILNRTQHRQAVHLATQDIENMSSIKNSRADYREFYTVEAAQQENLRIEKMLANPDEIQLPPEEKWDLVIAARRNQNFLFANQEKRGGDSPLMQSIKEELFSYEQLLNHEVDGENLDNELPVLQSAIGKCETILSLCNDYINRGRSWFIWRWKRFESVQKLRRRTENEMRILENLSNAEKLTSIKEFFTGKERISDLLNTTRYTGKLRKKKMEERKERNKDLKDLSAAAEERIERLDTQVSERIIADRKAKTGNDKGPVPFLFHVKAVSAMVGFGKVKLEDAEKFFTIFDKNVDFDLDRETIEHRKDYENKNHEEALEKNKKEKQEKIKCMEQVFDVIKSFDMNRFNIRSLEDLFNENYDKCLMFRRICLAGDDMLATYRRELKKEHSEVSQKYSLEDLAEMKGRIECVKKVSVLYFNIQKILKREEAGSFDLEACFTKNRSFLQKEYNRADANAANGDSTDKKAEAEKLFYSDMLAIYDNLYSETRKAVAFGPGKQIHVLLTEETQAAKKELETEQKKQNEAAQKNTNQNKAVQENTNQNKVVQKKTNQNKVVQENTNQNTVVKENSNQSNVNKEKEKQDARKVYNRELRKYEDALRKYKEDYQIYFLNELSLRQDYIKKKKDRESNIRFNESLNRQIEVQNEVNLRIAADKDYQKKLFDEAGDTVQVLMQNQLDNGKLVSAKDMEQFSKQSKEPEKFFANSKIFNKRTKLWSMIFNELRYNALRKKIESKPSEERTKEENRMAAAVHIRRLMEQINKKHLGLKWEYKEGAHLKDLLGELRDEIGKDLEVLGIGLVGGEYQDKWQYLDQLSATDAARLMKDLWIKAGKVCDDISKNLKIVFSGEEGYELTEVSENLLLKAVQAAAVKEGETVSPLDYPEEWHKKKMPVKREIGEEPVLDLSKLKAPELKVQPPVNPDDPQGVEKLLQKQEEEIAGVKDLMREKHAAEMKAVGWE